MKLGAQPMHMQCLKKLRSSLPRRRRQNISPMCLSASPERSIASSYLTREISCESSRISVNKPRVSPKKRRFEEISGSEESKEFQKVVKRENQRKEEEEGGSSCVQSCSGVDTRGKNSKLNRNANEIGETEVHSGTTTKTELSCVEQFSCEFSTKISKAVDENSIKHDQNRVSRIELSEVPQNVRFSNSESTAEHRPPKLNARDSDLACYESERICYEDISDYSSAFSDLQSDIFHDSSELDFSGDYTPSILFESGSEFSEKSIGDDRSPTPTFSFFLQYSQQFLRSTSTFDSKFRSCSDHEINEIFSWLRFDDDEHEESYQMFRNRERREVYFHDYAEEYCSKTEYGELVVQQRLQMVHWIVEQSTRKKFHNETMFLGVSLLDRFLSKGFFINKRNLQIVGIACLALATRIEENQPLNSVRQKTFYVESNTYSRCEVVAMEWLVQEVLNFQCLLPTIYNFLWFYLKAAKANKEVEKTAKHLAVLALLGHEQLCYWPSTIAAGLVILASLAANQDESCDHVMETHMRTKEDDLPGCMKSLEWLVRYAC